MPYKKRNILVKLHKKIEEHLESHDSIVRAIASRGCKEILTVEHGNFFYWVRLYKNGICDLFENNIYFDNTIEGLNKALKCWEDKITELKEKENIGLYYHKI